MSEASLVVLLVAGVVDPAKVIKDSQDFVNKYYGNESKMDMDDADEYIENLEAALELESDKITPAQKLSVLLNLSKVNNLVFKKKGKLMGMGYGKRSFAYLKKAVKLDPKSPEAARVYGEGVAGMVEAHSQGAIEFAIGVSLKDEANAAIKLLEDNGLKASQSYKTIQLELPKLKAKK